MSEPSERGRDRGEGTEAETIIIGPPPSITDGGGPVAAGTTGRWLVLLREEEDGVRAGMNTLSQAAGLTVATAADFEGGAVESEALAGADAVVFDQLGVAVLSAPSEQLGRVSAMATEESGILAVEPERIVYAIEDVARLGSLQQAALPVESLMAFQAGVNAVVEHLLGTGSAAAPGTTAPIATLEESQLTWGLQATNVAASQFTGKGVRVAVLDTGLDLGHPDFAGRQIASKSFISGQDVQDGHGHGTHCIGTACGPRQPGQLPRYGVAYGAEIFAGKVLSNQGSGSDGGILAGINWAVTSRCAIVSMSLGAATQVGQSFSRIFEEAARRALAAGTLIIAAAGNESARPGLIASVGHPANCPSIISVGALNSQLGVAPFSCGGINPQGGQVDIAGPGVAVRSSWPRPTLYRTINGTSMATPHVAGIAALHVEANKGQMVGGALGWLLLQSARRLDLPTRDVGSGLVQAPR